jgi:hypothetical protein
VAVDILELHESEKHARQYAEMSRIMAEMQEELSPRVRELNPEHTIAISYDVAWLPPSGKVMRAGLEMMKKAILGAAAGLRPGDEVDLTPRPNFIPSLEAHCYASATPSLMFFGMHAEQTGMVGEAAGSMAEFLLASSKPRQLEGFADARILAVDRAVMPFAEEVQVAIDARADRLPLNWTAIYFVLPGHPGSLSEVWSRAGSDTPEIRKREASQ